MPKLPLPDEATNELKLADWLEIYALLSRDGNSSRGDLESALTTASVLESGGRAAVEEKCLVVFNELEERMLAAGDAYPFKIQGAKLALKPNKETYSAYLFCLCLSYFQWSTKRSREVNVNPWLLFEELSAIAAAQYINGNVIPFGTSRTGTRKAMKGFREAVNTICLEVGEGVGFRPQSTLDKKDDKVDLIAWKAFDDRKTSKLIMFGQCAGGDSWKGKVSELNPEAFWDQWIEVSPVSPLVKSFYVPHRIHKDHWDYNARYGGIIFDRCRIAYWAFKNNKSIVRDARYRRWYKFILRVPNS